MIKNPREENPREGLKKYLKYLKIELKESRIFIFLLIMAAVFLLGPVWLNIPIVRDLLSDFLSPLGTQEYKSVYLEAISTLMGTFLAIYGALWTQRRIDLRDEVKKKRAALVVVYYDFEFAYEDLKNMFYEKDESGEFHESKIDLKMIIENIVKRGTENLFIDEEWIRNVASLSDVFNKDDLRMVFKMYGEINTVKIILDGMNLNKGKKEDQDGKDSQDDKKNQDNDDKEINPEIKRIETVLKNIFTVENGDKIVLCKDYKDTLSRIQTKMENSYTQSWKLYNIQDDIRYEKKSGENPRQ